MKRARIAFVFLALTVLAGGTWNIAVAADSVRWWLSPGLGLYAATINESVVRDLGLDRPGGLLVFALVRGGAAEVAGIKPGDVLAKWPDEIWSGEGKAGNVVVIRDGRSQSLYATSRKLSDEQSRILLRPATNGRRATTFVVDAYGAGNFRTMTAAMFRAAPGDTIIVKQGTYSESVLVQPQVTIKGAGKALVRFEIELPWLLKGPGATVISGITISGGGFGIEDGEASVSDSDFLSSDKARGIQVIRSKAAIARCQFRGATDSVGVYGSRGFVSVKNSLFSGHGNTAITLIEGSEGEVQDNLMNNNREGMAVFDSPKFSAVSNIITGTWSPEAKESRNDGIILVASSGTLAKNSVRRYRAGVFVSDGRRPLIITEASLTQGQYGIIILDSPAEVRDSLIMQNQIDGVYIGKKKDAPVQQREITLLRNNISGNDRNGVSIENVSRVTVRENLIEANGLGIRLYGGAASIENNTVVLQRSTGVFVYANSEAAIYNNIIALNSYGLFLDVTARRVVGFNDVYANLASTEFPLRDGNYGRIDRYTTRDGKKVPIHVSPAYDMKSETDFDVDPGFVKVGSNYLLRSDSPLARQLGKDQRHIGAYAPTQSSPTTKQ